MSSSLKNSILILTFVVLLPITAFTIIQLSSLSDDEEALENAYREQLDAIIFSINQYSADLFTFYFNQIDYQWQQSDNMSLYDSIFLEQNLAIEALAVRTNGSATVYDLHDDESFDYSAESVDSIFLQNQGKIDRLIRYKKTGYVKQEPLGSTIIDRDTLTISLIVIGDETPCLIFINPVDFIEDLLGPKIKELLGPRIQEIASKDLSVTITNVENGSVIYFDRSDSERGNEGIVQRGQLWLFNEFEIGVSLQDKSIEDLILFRTRRNAIILVLLVVLVLIGIALVIQNLRREIQLSKAKSDFVANVTHEIRTPLSLISMFNETLLLERVAGEEKKKEYYEIIAKETSRLNNIVNKILSFSQIDADKKSYQLESVCPNKEIREIINTYSYHLNEKGFEYQLDLEPNDVCIQGDKEALVEAIINLLDNAIKYSKDNKWIALKTILSANHYIIEVTDKGIGIPPSEQASIFEKFYRVTEGDRYQAKGTGLGLALVSDIMKAHDGKIELDSQPNAGSTFRLIFPIL